MTRRPGPCSIGNGREAAGSMRFIGVRASFFPFRLGQQTTLCSRFERKNGTCGAGVTNIHAVALQTLTNKLSHTRSRALLDNESSVDAVQNVSTINISQS
jgi:hypothetical protein